MSKRLHLIVAAILLWTLPGLSAWTDKTQTGEDVYAKLQNDLQRELNQIVTTNGLPGITFSLLFDYEHQITLASGYADREQQVKMTPTSKMLSGSVGKLFFSAVTLQLVQNGKLGLQEHVSKYLGDTEWYQTFPNHEEIKIIHLMNHTSGLPRHLFQPEFLNDLIKNPLQKRQAVDCIQSIANKPPVHPVGKGWAYSDTNYILLGLIVEKVTSEKIYDIVNKELLQPLGLSLTTPSDTLSIPALASGYIGAQNPFQLPKKVIDENGNLVVEPSFEWTGGGYATNPKDLATLVKFIHESDYLDTEMKNKLRLAINMATGQPSDNGYGLGTFIWSKMDDTRYGHSGFFPGYVTHVEYSKKRQYALAIQVNDDGAYPYLQQFLYQLEQVVNKYLDQIDTNIILQNFKQQEICWNKRDIECYMKAYASTEPIQTISRAGLTIGYENIISNYKKYFPADRMGRLHFDTLKTRRLADNLYFVTGRFNLQFDGRQELTRGWFSVTAKKIDGVWLIITDHSS